MADTKVINGVKTIDYRGKSYVEVAERLRHVHEQKREFQVLDSEVYEIAGRVVCRVTISVDGRIFKGIAEAKVNNAAPRSADATNPLECGETSALGRALAFAGFGTPDGIASYDEIARSLPIGQDENTQSNGGVANPPARPTPAPAQAKPVQPAPVPPQSSAQTETNKEPTPLNKIPVKSAIKKDVENGGYAAPGGGVLKWVDFVELAFSKQLNAKQFTRDQLLSAEWNPKYCEHAAAFLATLKKAA